MYELFLPYNLAVLAIEVGFTGQCFGEYRQWDGSTPYLAVYQDCSSEDSEPFTTECLAPMYQQIHNWLRVKKIRVIELPAGNKWVVFKEKEKEGDGHTGAYELNEAIEKALILSRDE